MAAVERTGPARGAAGRTRLTLLGVGAMRSPRYAPAGLLIEHRGQRVALDGGPGEAGRDAVPEGALDAWLTCDERAELGRELRQMARARGVQLRVGSFVRGDLRIDPHPVAHTAHPTFGYLVRIGLARVVWAPEFLELPRWAAGADLMFAEAAGYDRPIRFARGAGGHAAALDVAREATRLGVGELVFAHIGRPTIRALDRGERPPFGRVGRDGEVFALGPPARGRRHRSKPVPDVVGPGMRVLLVGVNPGHASARAGRHFANPANAFWRLVHDAGWSPRVLDPDEEHQLLAEGIGLTNLVARETGGTGEITREDVARGRAALASLIRRHRPAALVFVGVTGYRAFTGERGPLRCGEQPPVGSARVFVVPNPSGRNAHYTYRETLAAFRDVARELASAGLVPAPDARGAARAA